MAIDRPRLHCHTAFKHYQMFHRDCGSSYGNSVFNYTYNINSAPLCGGGFWNGILGGIGMGIGNLFGGMLGNIFGGFGFGGCFGGGMFGGGFPSFFGGGMMSPFSLYGNSYLNNPTNFWSIPSRNNNTENVGTPKGKKKAVSDKETVEPKKQAEESNTLTDDELEKLIKDANNDPEKLRELLDDKKYNLTKEQKKQINDKIKALNDAAARKAQEDAEAEAKIRAKAREEDDERRWPAEKWEKTPADVSKVTVTNKKYDKGDGKITIGNLKGAYDPKTRKVEGNQKLVSNKKHNNTNYPEFLSISDNDGNLHKYKCVGLTKDGYAVYKTPDSDENENYYVAVYDTEEQKYKLVQEGINDPSETIKPGKPDKQEFDTEIETKDEETE